MAILWAEIRRHITIEEFKKGLPLRVAYVVLQMADLMMTHFAISAGFEELNPIMRGLFETPAQLIIFKIVIPLAIAGLIPARLLLPALVLLLAVIGFNIIQLFCLL